jgi:polysaccharide export outer membrane protein
MASASNSGLRTRDTAIDIVDGPLSARCSRCPLHPARLGWLAAILIGGSSLVLAGTPQPGSSSEYIIGPGDTLQVFVWRNPDLTVTVPVRPDGRISTPLVEDMPAVGKTPTQLARDVEKVLAEYVRSPEVNIIVTQPANALNQVKVIGQVQKPAPIPYREGMTVLDALLAVGGLGTFAAGNRSHLVRTVDGKQTEIPLKLDALLNKGDMSQNLTLRPGDVLVVPESRF